MDLSNEKAYPVYDYRWGEYHIKLSAYEKFHNNCVEYSTESYKRKIQNIYSARHNHIILGICVYSL